VVQKDLRHLERSEDSHKELCSSTAAEMAGTAEKSTPVVSQSAESSMVRTSQASSSERALLCGVLLDYWGPADLAAAVSDFQDGFHRRVLSCINAMSEAGEPLSVPIIAGRMRLDELETAQLQELLDPLLVTRRKGDLEGHIRLVQRAAREREVRLACEEAARADGDMTGLIAEVEAKTKKYLDSLRQPAPGQELFDTWDEFENAPDLSFAIKGFLQNDAITAIAGLSGHGKTWNALSIARGLLLGPGRLWDLFDVPERAERVIYLIPESSRTAIKHRLKLMDLYDEIYGGRLLMRTLSKGPTPLLSDPRLLHEAKNAYVITDTAIRFMGATDESSASEVAEALSNDFLGLLRAEARAVIPLFHSPKSFTKEATMTLEGMIRGSSELGAVLATAWGIKQIDRDSNTVHIQNLKCRDFEPCGAFQIIARPFIEKSGDFALFKRPEECGSLAEEQPELHSRHNSKKHDQRIQRVATVAAWLAQDPNVSSREMVERFKSMGVNDVNEGTIKKYRMDAKKSPL
jgi:hypothetical protein